MFKYKDKVSDKPWDSKLFNLCASKLLSYIFKFKGNYIYDSSLKEKGPENIWYVDLTNESEYSNPDFSYLFTVWCFNLLISYKYLL